MGACPGLGGGRAFRRPSPGFTFVEILIALGILALGFLPMLSLFGSQAVTVRDLSDYSIAVNLAERQLHKYIQIINNLEASDTIEIQGQDLSPEVKGDCPEQTRWLNGLKMVGTVKKADLCPARSYEVSIVTTWGHQKRYDLWTVVPQREMLVATTTPLEGGKKP